MSGSLAELFADHLLVQKIQKRLPELFRLAELESSRAGKVGMEVGSLRERIITALLIHKFGESNVQTQIPITAPEVDVKLYGIPISIKTITGSSFAGVKLVWTVDPKKAESFSKQYQPCCEMLLIQIHWGHTGGFFHIPLSAQKRLFQEMGREKYIQLPRPGTNPRGVEISRDALTRLIEDAETKSIRIHWQQTSVKFNPYARWIDLWKED